MSNEKPYSRDFKAKVVLETISDDATDVKGIAGKYKVTTRQILGWAQEMDLSDTNMKRIMEKLNTSDDTELADNYEIESNNELFLSDMKHGVTLDLLNYRRLVFWSLFGVGFVLLTVLALFEMNEFNQATSRQQVSEQSDFYQIGELRQRDQNKLSSFGVVNLEDGIYHVPIDSIISRMAEEAD